MVVVICVCTGAATQPHACVWEAWLASGGEIGQQLAYECEEGGRTGSLVRRSGDGETLRRVVCSQEFDRT